MNIAKGKSPQPPRLLLYGTEGIGKSTFGASSPGAIFIPTEDGLGQIDCHRFAQAKAVSEVMASLNELAKEKHEYQTVVVDSLDWLERLIWDQVCADYGVKSIEKADGGYGKGYVHALAYWRRILDALDGLRREKGMATVLVAHAKIERFEDPEAPAYDRYSPRINKHASAMICEWCDAVLFAARKMRVEKESGRFGADRTVAVPMGKDGGERIIRTVGSPACVAKNRYSLPAELPLSWSDFINSMKG